MKKYKDLIIFLIICLAIIFVRFAVIRTITAKALYYTVNDDGKTCTITGCKNEDIKRLYVPRKINGYKVTKIAPHSFCGLDELKSVIIPGSVQYLGSMNFDGDWSLDITNVWLPSHLYCDTANEKLTIYYDEEKKGYYVGLMRRSEREGIAIPEKIKGKPVIGLLEDAFAWCGEYQHINIPDSVQYYEKGAFQRCWKINDITLNVNTKEINSSLFWGCYRLSDIVIPEGVEVIGDNAFMFCTSLKSIYIPEGVKSIGDGAICWNDSLETVYFPRSVEFIERHHVVDGNLANCPALTSIHVYKDSYAESWCIENGFSDLIKYVE